MSFDSLLVSCDTQAIRVVERVLDEMGAGLEVCGTAERAYEALARRNVEALLIDFEHRGAVEVLRRTRRPGMDRNRIALGMINPVIDVSSAFKLGANLVVHKPLSIQRATASLRTAQGLIRRERRRHGRNRMQVTASLSIGGAEIQSVVLDLSETGMLVQATEPVYTAHEIHLQVYLPGNKNYLEGRGELMWADQKGQAGIRFLMPPSSPQRKLLAAWLEHLNTGPSMHDFADETMFWYTDFARRSAPGGLARAARVARVVPQLPRSMGNA